MEALNQEFNGSLTLAIQIFKAEYHRPFLNQLVSGQLDMDRTDYLKRDSFYTGYIYGRKISCSTSFNVLAGVFA